MQTVKLAFLGFGNVGRALARLLLAKEAQLLSQYQLAFRVTGIATGGHGIALDPNGLDLQKALRLAQAGDDLSELSTLGAPAIPMDLIQRCEADVLFENTPVNYETGQPALDHLRASLERGMHAITANKGPVVHGYRELTALAKKKGRRFLFESTVMDGAPIFSLFREALPGANLKRFRGVLNSTTNLILTRMETGESFEDAVRFAQSIGIAETDPSGDIDGWDAAVKVAALATVLMDTPLKPAAVDRSGIRAITSQDVTGALKDGERWKLVCSAERTPQGLKPGWLPNGYQ
jgi:homoserine dehydrogenase